MTDCYQLADDTRELILARLAAVLAAVPGVVTFARNDAGVVEGTTPSVLLLDGDEDNGSPESYGRGRPANSPVVMVMKPEVYVLVASADPGPTLNALRDAIVSAVLNDSQLLGLCYATDPVHYEGAQSAFASGRTLEGEMGLNFTFHYVLRPVAPCVVLDVPDDPMPGSSARERIMSAIARAVEATEGVSYFQRNDITLPEESATAAVFLLEGAEVVETSFYGKGRPPTVPKPAATDPEVYAFVVAAPEDVGPALNRLRLMIVRSVLNDPWLTGLAMDGDVRYEGLQTGLALGRSLAGEMGMKFSMRYVLKP